jgi:hypothetical protein
MTAAKQLGKLSATILLLAIAFPVFCFSLAASPFQATVSSACHHSAPVPVLPASHQKCCAAGPATKALLSARYTPPAPAIVGQTTEVDPTFCPILNAPMAERPAPASPPGFGVLRI